MNIHIYIYIMLLKCMVSLIESSVSIFINAFISCLGSSLCYYDVCSMIASSYG